jgi:predicted ATPase
MKLKEIHIEGYRSLLDVTLSLRDLCVMIGANGSGKTALLEVFLLLQRAAEANLAKHLDTLGGAQAILSQTADSPARAIKISLSADLEKSASQEPIKYRLELAPRGTGYAFPSERLEWHRDVGAANPFIYIDAQYDRVSYFDPETRRLNHPTWNYNVHELALAQVPRMYTEPEALRSLLASILFFSSLDVNQRAVIRLPQSLTPERYPGPNGENLYSALYNLEAMDSKTYRRIEELLRIGYPSFDRLKFPVVGAGQVTLAWYQKGLSKPLYPNQLSEGTLRFLWLITVLLSPDAPAILLLDEPEVSMHPELLKLLAGLLQDVAIRSQVLVATHSPDLIRWLQPSEVLITEKNEAGTTEYTWADSLNLDEWLKEYTLRDLMVMGTLGGRP